MTPRRLLTWLLILLLPVVLLVGYGLLRAGAAHSAPSIFLQPNSSIQIDIAAGAAARLYSFRANASEETLLKLDTGNPDFAFSAEIRDSSGETIAILEGARLKDAKLTLEPGDELYQIAVSAAAPDRPGSVALTVGAPEPPPRPTPATTVCGMVSALETGTPIYSAPRPGYAIVGTLRPADLLVVRGRIRGGWLVAEVNGQAGWLPGDAVRLYGTCDAVPLVLDPAIPSAPADSEPYVLTVDRDGDGQLSQIISYPNHDPFDFVWINVLNLYDRPPANYRQFTIALSCEGVGAEAVRWGAPQNPVHQCGEAITLPFLHDLAQQPLIIRLPDGSEQSYVRYTVAALSSQRAA